MLWIFGEPGIGKTRLATESAQNAHAEGALVLFGRCSEDLTVPYQPFLESLRRFAAQVDADARAATPAACRSLSMPCWPSCRRMAARGRRRCPAP